MYRHTYVHKYTLTYIDKHIHTHAPHMWDLINLQPETTHHFIPCTWQHITSHVGYSRLEERFNTCMDCRISRPADYEKHRGRGVGSTKSITPTTENTSTHIVATTRKETLYVIYVGNANIGHAARHQHSNTCKTYIRLKLPQIQQTIWNQKR